MTLRRLLFCALAALPVRAACQSDALDLRIAEFNRHGDITYQNFIYAHNFAGNRFSLLALYLRLPPLKYNEVELGGAVRVATLAGVDILAVAGVARATDGNYLEPAILVQRASGPLSFGVFAQRYVPLSDAGVGQWLLDPAEFQYNLVGPFTVGAALYAYRADGGTWLTKVGPKVGVADRYGVTELRVTRVSEGGHEIQVRRIIQFK